MTAAGCERVERRREAREWPRVVCDMLGIVRDEILDQMIDLLGRQGAAIGLEAALDQRPRPAADHVARGLVGDRRQAFASEHGVECSNEIGRGIDQRSVEVENGEGGDYVGDRYRL